MTDSDICKEYITALMKSLDHPIAENDIISIIQAFHPEFSRRDIHMTMIRMESEKILRAMHSTVFVLNRS